MLGAKLLLHPPEVNGFGGYSAQADILQTVL